jgi:hypothetical protein
MLLAFPAQVEFGLLDLEGVQITVPTDETWGAHPKARGRASDGACECGSRVTQSSAPGVFGEVFDKAGYERPHGIHGFPPGPPHP